MFAVARHFNCSPAEVLYQWPLYLFLDALESMEIEAEINHRISEAQER